MVLRAGMDFVKKETKSCPWRESNSSLSLIFRFSLITALNGWALHDSFTATVFDLLRINVISAAKLTKNFLSEGLHNNLFD
jgi:hypothetical protein